jgi:hypothetical protein
VVLEEGLAAPARWASAYPNAAPPEFGGSIPSHYPSLKDALADQSVDVIVLANADVHALRSRHRSPHVVLGPDPVVGRHGPRAPRGRTPRPGGQHAGRRAVLGCRARPDGHDDPPAAADAVDPGRAVRRRRRPAGPLVRALHGQRSLRIERAHEMRADRRQTSSSPTSRSHAGAHSRTSQLRTCLATWFETGEAIGVYTRVPPLNQRRLDRLPPWTRAVHEQFTGDVGLGDRDRLALYAGTADASRPFSAPEAAVQRGRSC